MWQLRVHDILCKVKKGSLYVGMATSVICMVDIALGNIVHAAANDWHITTHFGDLDEMHSHPHNGIDYAVAEGTPVRSIVDGKVISVLDEGHRSWGRSVHIMDAKGEVIIYGHLSHADVHVGQEVHFGDVVAHSGNTGYSSGPHLHVQVNINGKPIDPTPLIREAQLRKISKELASQ